MITKKGKIIAITACAALALSLGTMTAFAASTSGGPSFSKMQDGKASYSTDEGKTWIDGTLDGANTETDENGGILTWVGDEKPGNDANGFAMKNEDGNTLYSTDGGKSWSENAPDGFNANSDGSISMKNGNSNSDAKTDVPLLHRVQDGKSSYSTDDGKTWTDGTPGGFNTKTDENGGTLTWIGSDAPPAPGDGAVTYSNNAKTVDGEPVTFSRP